MRSLKKVENNSRIASRRFSKGIICNIITGTAMVSFIQASGLVPKGLEFFQNSDVAYSYRRQRVFVVPSYNYDEMRRLAADAGLMFPATADTGFIQNPGRTSLTEEQQKTYSVFTLEREVRKKDILYQFLQQNMIMVAIQSKYLPKDMLSYLKDVDVIIDSIDTGQAVRGDFVNKSRSLPGDYTSWADGTLYDR
jgi:hypothetical protein